MEHKKEPLWSIRQLVWQNVHPYMTHILAMIFLSICFAADHSLVAYLIKWLIDGMQACSAVRTLTPLILPAVLYLISGMVIVFLFRVWDWLFLQVMPAVEARTMTFLTQYVYGHAHQFYQAEIAGSLVARINDVAKNLPDLLELCIQEFFNTGVTVLIALIVLWYTVPFVSGIILVWLLVFMGTVMWRARYIHALANRAAGIRAQVLGQVGDVTSNMLMVRLFNGSGHERRLLQQELEIWIHAVRTRDWALLKLSCIQVIVWQIREMILIWWLLIAFQRGAITAGDAALVFTLVFQITRQMWKITRDVTKCMKVLGAISQGIQVLMKPYTLVDTPHAPALHVTQGQIIFEHVSFEYEDGKPFFVDCSIDIKPGKKIGLVGYSGSGKSTFVSLILRLYDVKAGTISIDGHNIAHVRQDSVRAAIAFIPQDPSLFHRTLYDNISYGNFDATHEEVIVAARRAHAHDFITSLPEGYETLVGDRGVRLSGGQRQRIAIARALLKRAKILIMDEATSALDSITERYIQQSLVELSSHHTMIVIAHRLATLLAMDRIIVFDQGRIVEEGTHQELLARHGKYAELWNSQIDGFIPDIPSVN